MIGRKPQIITFGETMALFMPDQNHSIERAEKLQQGFGGAESNVAIGLARLGVDVGWFSKLGEDPFAARIVKTIRGEGVDVSRVTYTDQASTGMMLRELVCGKVAVHYFRKHSAASIITVDDLDEEYIGSAQILHITGITPALSQSCKQTIFRAVEIAKQAGVKVSFDPNLRLKLWTIEEAREIILPLAEQADYFLPGWDELKLLYNTADAAVIDKKLHDLNAVSIVKGKGDSNVIYENGQEVHVPFYPAEQVVDTVGAGDAFCAGFLAGIAKGLSPLEAVRIASVTGSIVVQTHGDWEALPTWKDVERRLSAQEWIER
ncbi:sugar kinase [Paenibacillus endoradicis]|uniref:sugar kinase n=1 Tax=Paenibacillus endoradicis TaxID=2972487 RepID=UPI002159471C|nr:sugar kinase [Paenibacillus endoradicis]MCR8657974.1 sugar kinase [Paenibacillus endoradicis]